MLSAYRPAVLGKLQILNINPRAIRCTKHCKGPYFPYCPLSTCAQNAVRVPISLTSPIILVYVHASQLASSPQIGEIGEIGTLKRFCAHVDRGQ